MREIPNEKITSKSSQIACKFLCRRSMIFLRILVTGARREDQVSGFLSQLVELPVRAKMMYFANLQKFWKQVDFQENITQSLDSFWRRYNLKIKLIWLIQNKKVTSPLQLSRVSSARSMKWFSSSKLMHWRIYRQQIVSRYISARIWFEVQRSVSFW